MEWNSERKNRAALEAGRESRMAVFAGSFDPFTIGHLDIVQRAAGMFDSLVVLVSQNASKKNLFSAEIRCEMAQAAVSHLPNVSVAVNDGLTVDFMKSVGARYLVRGIRNASDLDAEQAVAWNNKVLYPDVETVFLLSAQDHLVISSSLVRELLKCGCAKGTPQSEQKKLISKFVPQNMVSMLLKQFRKLYETV